MLQVFSGICYGFGNTDSDLIIRNKTKVAKRRLIPIIWQIFMRTNFVRTANIIFDFVNFHI